MDTHHRFSLRSLRKRIRDLLSGSRFDEAMAEVSSLPGRKAVNPIIGLFCDREDLIRWRAVSAFGVVVGHLADTDMESARVVMRRLMWTLNDESGGIGWGAPEAMGEAVARHAGIAAEYGGILVSYLREDCNYLEHEGLQRGLLWGIGRYTHARPDQTTCIGPLLIPFLSSADPYHRGLAVWALRGWNGPGATDLMDPLRADSASLVFYSHGRLHDVTVGQMASGAYS
jgi:hypothetical protein